MTTPLEVRFQERRRRRDAGPGLTPLERRLAERRLEREGIRDLLPGGQLLPAETPPSSTAIAVDEISRPGAPPELRAPLEGPPAPSQDVQLGGTSEDPLGLGEVSRELRRGLGGSIAATLKGTGALAKRVSDAIPIRPKTGPLAALRATGEVGTRAGTALQERVGEPPEDVSGRGVAAGIAGRMGGDVAQIIALNALLPGSGFARGTLLGVPLAGAQAFGGEESSSAAAAVDLFERTGREPPALLEEIVASPTRRAATEAIFDMISGGAGEAAIRAAGRGGARAAAAAPAREVLEGPGTGFRRLVLAEGRVARQAQGTPFERLSAVEEGVGRGAEPSSAGASDAELMDTLDKALEGLGVPPEVREIPDGFSDDQLTELIDILRPLVDPSSPAQGSGLRIVRGGRAKQGAADRELEKIIQQTEVRDRKTNLTRRSPEEIGEELRQGRQSLETARLQEDRVQTRLDDEGQVVSQNDLKVRFLARRRIAELEEELRTGVAELQSRDLDHTQIEDLITGRQPTRTTGELEGPEFVSRPRPEPEPKRTTGPIEGRSDMAITRQLIVDLERIGQENARFNKGFTAFTREDPNIGDVRSGTRITGDAARARGRAQQAGDRIDRMFTELKRRGLSDDQIERLQEQALERMAIEDPELGGVIGSLLSSVATGGAGAAAGAVVGEEVAGKKGRIPGALTGLGLSLGATAALRRIAGRFVSPKKPGDTLGRFGRKGAAPGTGPELRPPRKDATKGRRRLAHARAEGKPAVGTKKVQFTKFGLSDEGARRLEQEVDKLGTTTRAGLRTTTFKEHLKTARNLGFDDVKVAHLNRQVTGDTLLGMRALFNRNAGELDTAYRKLDKAVREGAPKTDVRRLEFEIDAREAENADLLKMFIPGASEAGRTLGTLRIMAQRALRPESLFTWTAAIQRQAGRSLLPEEIAAIRRALAARDEKALMKVAQQILPTPGVLRSLVQIRRAGFLTGLRTQARNAVSNLSEAVMRQLDDPLAAGLDRIVSAQLGTARTRVLVDPVKRIAASRKGARKGMTDMWLVMTGKKRLGAAELRKLDMTSDLMRQSMFGDAYVRFMFRAQGAVDQPWRQAAFMESILEQTTRLGLDFDETAAQALKSIEGGLPDEIALRAMIDAEESVFQNATRLGSSIGMLKNALGEGRTAVEWFIPFTQTPSAIFMRLIDRTPIGLVRGAAGLRRLSKELDLGTAADVLFDLQRMETQRIGRSVTGMLALGLGMLAWKKGRASGAWPLERKELDRWFQEGKGPDSFFINGKWRRMTGISPIGNLLSVGAAIGQALDEQRDPAKVDLSMGEQIASNLIVQTGRTFVENTFMRGLEDFMETFGTGPSAAQQGTSRAQRFKREAARSFSPIIVRDITQLLDPIHRDPRTLIEAFKSVTPGLSFQVAARLDETGKPKITNPNVRDRLQRFVDPLLSQRPRGETDPFLAEANRIGATVSRPGRNTKGGRLTIPQWRQRQTGIGTERNKARLALQDRPRYKLLTKAQQAAAFEDVMGDVSSLLTRQSDDGFTFSPPRSYAKLITAAIVKARDLE